MKIQWDNEKNAVESVQKIKEEIDRVNHQIDLAQRESDYDKAAELTYGKLPELQKKMKER